MFTPKFESFKAIDNNRFVNPSEPIYSSGQTHLEPVASAVESGRTAQIAQTLQATTPPLSQSFKNTAKMFTIRILGMGDAKTRALKDNLTAALVRNPVKGKVVEVSELNHITLSGVTETPALMFDNVIVSEGIVPSVEDLTKLLRNRNFTSQNCIACGVFWCQWISARLPRTPFVSHGKSPGDSVLPLIWFTLLRDFSKAMSRRRRGF